MAEVVERTRRLVPVPGGIGNGVRLEERRGVAGIHLDLGAADVDERVRARLLVAEPGRQLERPLPPLERLLGVLREHRQLREAAVRARQLDRLAERLEDRDRLERLRARGVAVARDPVESRQDPGATAHARRRRLALREIAIARSMAGKASSSRPTR